MTGAHFTHDQFLKGRVKLKQKNSGHRAGSDAVFLAATVSPEFQGLLVDAGSASGAVGLMAAWRAPAANVRLIEIDHAEVELARENSTQNGMDQRVHVMEADLFAPHAQRAELGLCAGDADLVLSNPPYLDEGAVRSSHDEERARAHMMPEGGLEKWLLACLAMLKANGILTFIHRADRLDELLKLMQGRFGEIAILPIHPRDNDAATRILVSGKRNSRAPLRILPSFVIHGDTKDFTPRAAAVHAGDAAITLR